MRRPDWPPRLWSLCVGSGLLDRWANTASPTSRVVEVPSWSGASSPAPVVTSIARFICLASSSGPKFPSISAPLTIPLPAMSGAEPCIGSNMLGWRRCGSRLALATTPRLPAKAQVGEDVGKQVGGYDSFQVLRPEHEAG
jgi:hypothetical protein